MSESQESLRWVVIGVLLLVPAYGLMCPLPEDGDSSSPHVSLCAMCSHNEAAVRWNRSLDGDPVYRTFILTYSCSGSDSIASVPAGLDHDPELSDVCPWYNDEMPLDQGQQPTSGISSIGRELRNGTRCTFTLYYNIKFGNSHAESFSSTSSCTVDANCETNARAECNIDQVCTFFNDTQGDESVCSECSCTEGYDGDECSNVDECKVGNTTCDENADCHDTDGSYWCQCRSGFTGDGYNCTDINECETQNYTCSDENAYCVNFVGNVSCQCNPGFTGDGYNCSDVDECVTCSDENAHCVNSVGNFSCQCNPGFTGDGYNCSDVDECVTKNPCFDENAHCVNSVGHFSCQCNLGYTGDGYNCSDINECETQNDTCSNENAHCVNSVGNFTCQCNLGFTGDGYNCSATTNTGSANIIIAISVGTTGALLLVVILLVVVSYLKIKRSDKVNFDALTVKTIDPFYSPIFMGGSLISIHSKYECLYVSTHTGDNVNEVSIQKSVERDETGVDSVGSETDKPTSPSKQEVAGNAGIMSYHLLPDEPLEKEVSGFMSSDDSPYIAEELVSSNWRTQSTHSHQTENSNSSDDSTDLPFILPTEALHQRTHDSVLAGYVDDSTFSRQEREDQVTEVECHSAGYFRRQSGLNEPMTSIPPNSGYIQ